MSLTTPNISPVPLVLGDLGNGRKGITPAFGQTLVEAASVCLEEQGHASPTEIQITGHFASPGKLEWNIPSDQSRRCWNDDGYATEQGAYGIAALLVEHCGLEVVSRSKKKTGFDFWLGSPHQENSLFQDVARLEVSGIRNGDSSTIDTRVRQKLKQTTPSDGKLPAIVVVVEFGNPTVKIIEK
jgi:hypothetical protein